MTLGELKAALEALTPEQLAQPARWWGEERGGEIERVAIVKEELVNPTGDCWEPLRSYQAEVDSGRVTFDEIRADGGVIPAGTAVLEVD
jgi:hypothetical protein